MQATGTQNNSGKVKILKTNKLLDLSKPQYKKDRTKHSWCRTDKRVVQ